MPNGSPRISELLSTPMEAAVVGLGAGIARAQRELDRSSIEMQREIDEDPELAELGLHASWYQMPRAELELTITVSLEETAPALGGPPAAAPPTGFRPLPFLAANRLAAIRLTPVNAFYKNQFDYDVQASSKLKLTFVPVPPPVGETTEPARMTREEVLAAADASLKHEADARLGVNFNGAARLWFVLEYRLVENRVERRALVVIDDETGTVVKSETES
jgi:hypothetical protein